MISAESIEAPAEAGRNVRGESLWRRGVRRLLRKKIAVACLIFIFLFYFVAAFAPLLAPYDYAEQNLDIAFEGPSWDHPFGTDRNGRDVLSRVIFATRTTGIITIATVATGSIMLPLTLGMLAGYRGGWVDSIIMRTGEILAALPALPMLVLINATMRPRFVEWVEDLEGVIRWDGLTKSGGADYFLIVLVLSLFGWIGGARLIRVQVQTLRSTEYVLAAESNGASTLRILFRHMLPNVLPFVIVGVSAALGAIAAAEVGLTFLGVGIHPPNPSFGALVADGTPRSVLVNHPQLLLVPAAVITMSILAFNLLGDAINDVLTPGAK
jgi:ABC-type dipeptide/oligopeptide/nickel transport system permease subunit